MGVFAWSEATRCDGCHALSVSFDVPSGPEDYFSSAMVLRSVPMLETSISSTSPAFIHTGGFCLAPMPSGVPVAMMSPGDSGVNTEQNAWQRPQR